MKTDMVDALDNTRILLTTPYDLNVPGGVNTQLWGLYRYLKRVTTAQVRIIGPASNPDAVGQPDVTCLGSIFRLPMNGAMSNLTLDRRIKPRILELMRSFSPDIVHFQEPFAPALNNYVLKYSRAFNVATFHTYRERLSFGYLAAWPYLKYMLSRIHAPVAVSKVAAGFVGRLFPADYRIVPNAIAPPTGRRSKEPLLPTDRKNILFVGRVREPRKGFSYMLSAYRRLEDTYPGVYRLVVVGASDRRFAARSTFGDIRWMGKVPDDQLHMLYAECDLVCAPSIRGESFGVVLLEAFSHEKPVVGFRNAGYHEFLGDRPAAELVGLYDDRALAEAVHAVCSNPARRIEMSRAAATVAAQYRWDVIGPRLTDIYTHGLTRIALQHDARRFSSRLA